MIGNESVDIIPSEISYIYANALTYNPRPVIQSYTAYTGYLDGLNRIKYMSDSAPTFILFSAEAIDRRYAFFDEPQTKRAILQNYEVVSSANLDDSKMILLKRRARSRDLLRVSLSEGKFGFPR